MIGFNQTQNGAWSITSVDSSSDNQEDAGSPVTESDEATKEDQSPAGQEQTIKPIQYIMRKLDVYQPQITAASALTALGVSVYTWVIK